MIGLSSCNGIRMKASPIIKRFVILGCMFKRLGLIFIILLGFTNPIAAAEPEVVKLAEGVYGFIGKEGATNSGFVVTNEGVVVIDTQGPKELALLLKKKIHEITNKPVVYVINTHFHGDHIFGNQYFKKAREIISHENTNRNLIEKDKQHREQFKKFFGENSLEGFELTLPTKTFKNTLSLRIGGKTIELAYLGKGHTDGDIIVYFPIERIMFGGDLLFNLQQYLIDLQREVKKYIAKGKTIDEIKKEIKLPKYKNWLKYKEWLPLNAESVYRELKDQRQE